MSYTEEQKNKCPNREILDTVFNDFGDCYNYGSSDCPICVDEVECCVSADELKEILRYKYQ